MNKILTLLLLFYSVTVMCQSVDLAKEELVKVDVEPVPIGGYPSLYEFIGKNIHYTDSAFIDRVEGKVFVKFVVSKEGVIIQDSTEIIKGLGYGFDEQVINAINMASGWTPGYITQTGKYVSVRFVLPVIFKLPEKTSTKWSNLYIRECKKVESETKNYNEMLRLINTAISMNKKLGNNYFMRAYIYQELGNNKLACKDL